MIDHPTPRATPRGEAALPSTVPVPPLLPADAVGWERDYRPGRSADAASAPTAPAESPQSESPQSQSPPSVDVVFADLTPDLTDDDGAPVDGRLGMIAARALRGGGILAVVTRCHPGAGPDGALLDVTGEVVASAQNADLLYLQHIVIPTEPLRPPRPTDAAMARPDRDRPAQHEPQYEVGHADLLVFARPHTRGAHPTTWEFVPGDAIGGAPTCAVFAGVESSGSGR
jgi:hypothetical protein